MEFLTNKRLVNELPEDVMRLIMSYSPMARSILCMTNKGMNTMAMEISAKLSPLPGLWKRLNQHYDRDVIISIIESGDLHLLIRIARGRDFGPVWTRFNLYASYKSGNREMIEFVKERHGIIGAMAHATMESAFKGACEGGHMRLVQELITGYIEESRNMKNELTHSGLIGACEGGQFEIFNYLFDCYDYDSDGLTELMINACIGGNVGIISAIYASADDSYVWESDVWEQSLKEACERGRLEAARLVLKYRVDYFNEYPPWEPLACACSRYNREIVELLFDTIGVLSERIEFDYTGDNPVPMCEMYIEYAGFTAEMCIEDARREEHHGIADMLMYKLDYSM